MIVRSTFLKFAITSSIVFGVVVLILNIQSYNENANGIDFIGNNNAYVISNSGGDQFNPVKADFKSNSKPTDSLYSNGKIDIPNVSVRTYVTVTNHELEQNVLVRKAGESLYTVLLLHGQAFSSKNWETIGTLQFLASWGYQAIAIDLPGYGNSSLPVVQAAESGQWLIKFIRILRLSDFVIISPSMSGRFSIPYVMQSNSQQSSLRGFIPISPVGTSAFKSEDYKRLSLPTLIVHGEHDAPFKSAIETLKQIPTSEIITIKNASHACYIEQSEQFHNALRQFLYKVYRPIYLEEQKKRSNSLTSSVSSVNHVKDNKL